MLIRLSVSVHVSFSFSHSIESALPLHAGVPGAGGEKLAPHNSFPAIGLLRGTPSATGRMGREAYLGATLPRSRVFTRTTWYGFQVETFQ